jgi:hypothetical protein
MQETVRAKKAKQCTPELQHWVSALAAVHNRHRPTVLLFEEGHQRFRPSWTAETAAADLSQPVRHQDVKFEVLEGSRPRQAHVIEMPQVLPLIRVLA